MRPPALSTRALTLLLAGALAATTAGPACLVLACPMVAPCDAMAAMAEPEPCCELAAFSAPLTTCCDEGGLTAALRKAASDDLSVPAAPQCAGLPPERPSGERPLARAAVPPAPPPDGGLYTLHATFLI